MVNPCFSFDTRRVARSLQFEMFRREFSNFEDYGLPAGARGKDGFAATCNGYDLGRLKLALFRTDAHTVCPTRFCGGRLGPEYWILSLQLEGRTDLETDGRMERLGRGSFSLRKHDQPRRGQVTDSVSICLYLPREEFGGLEHALDRMTEPGETCTVFLPHFANYIAALAKALPAASRQDCAQIAKTVISILRRCVSLQADTQSKQAASIAARLEVAKRLISSHSRPAELTPEKLCDELNVSLRQLHVIFEGVGGLGRFLRSVRLRACHDEIIVTGRSRPICAIAEEFGFSSGSRFISQFRREIGATPGELRSRAHACGPSARFMAWLGPQEASKRTL